MRGNRKTFLKPTPKPT